MGDKHKITGGILFPGLSKPSNEKTDATVEDIPFRYVTDLYAHPV